MADTSDDTPAKKTAKPKAAATRKPAAKAPKVVVAAPAAEPVGADAAPEQPAKAAAVIGTDLKKKDLIDRVTTLVGAKKKGVKEIVEATLAVLGDALSSGESLNLPPFGKARVNRQKDMPSGEMMIVKLRRGAAKPAGPGQARKAAKQALAVAGD